MPRYKLWNKLRRVETWSAQPFGPHTYGFVVVFIKWVEVVKTERDKTISPHLFPLASRVLVWECRSWRRRHVCCVPLRKASEITGRRESPGVSASCKRGCSYPKEFIDSLISALFPAVEIHWFWFFFSCIFFPDWYLGVNLRTPSRKVCVTSHTLRPLSISFSGCHFDYCRVFSHVRTFMCDLHPTTKGMQLLLKSGNALPYATFISLSLCSLSRVLCWDFYFHFPPSNPCVNDCHAQVLAVRRSGGRRSNQRLTRMGRYMEPIIRGEYRILFPTARWPSQRFFLKK